MTPEASGLPQGGPAGMDGRRNPWYTVREAEQKEMNTEAPMAVFTSAAFALRRKLITDALEKAGAKTPATAKTLADAGVENPDLFPEYTEKLVWLGAVRRTRDGRYYLAGE